MEQLQNLVWPIKLLPLTVWYSPLLRLRYRVSFSSCAKTINKCYNKDIFQNPKEPSRELSVDIENNKTLPPEGTVYVMDSENRHELKDTVVFYKNETGLISAVVFLPEDEDSPYSTIGITMHGICSLLGITELDRQSV